MKNSGFRQLSYDESLAKKIAADEKRRNKPKSAAAKAGKERTKQQANGKARLEGEWKFSVRKQYDYTCQYPSCTVRDQHIDCHHVNPRSQRKDLLYVLSNGKTMCRFHHDWIRDNPEEAQIIGLLRVRSRELAAKEGTIGIY
jgi:hypothetical protein